MKRDLISLQDFSTKEIGEILDLAKRLKRDRGFCADHLKGKSIGLLFQKPSNRTRVSFEVGVYQLGGKCLYLGPEEINLGVRESTADVAQTLSRYLDGMVARTHTHQDIVDLAQYARIPVINGLSDLYHPCQALADVFSIQEKFGKLKGVSVAYIGDGNNVCHSLMLACAKVGAHLRIATPEGYEPREEVLEKARACAQETGAMISLSHVPQEAARGADVIYADVWVSMGQEVEREERMKRFGGYQVNRALLNHSKKDVIVMHCLPAHRGEEIAAEVIDGPRSVVIDEAENRLHVQKAIMEILM